MLQEVLSFKSSDLAFVGWDVKFIQNHSKSGPVYLKVSNPIEYGFINRVPFNCGNDMLINIKTLPALQM